MGTLGSVGIYRVLRVIGAGGMGLVVLAREPGSPREVAIKLLRPELRASPVAVKRFLGEARHMSQLDHPHVLKIIAIGADSDLPHYVMPYLRRGSLAHLLSGDQPLTVPEMTRLAREVAEAIAFAHGRGLIHRDLKPGNVLIGDDRAAYVCDFGLVRTIFNDTNVDASREQLEGSAPYMSPAVARGQAEDTRCDIYSFGAMLYEMLTGRPPYQGRTTQQIIEKIRAGPPESIRKLNPQAHARLARVAETCMARPLRDRYASMEDVAEDLRRIEHGQPPRLQARRGARLAWVTATTAVLLMVAALVASKSPLRTDRGATTRVIVPTFDLVADFPGDGQPRAPWQFGSKVAIGGSWTPLDHFERTARDHPMFRGATTRPAVICNPFTTSDFAMGLRIDPRSILMLGAYGEAMPAARFRAPESGRYEIAARIDPLAEELRFAQILFAVLNDRRLVMSVGTPASPPGNWAGRLLSLEAGDRLDFVLAHPVDTRLPGAKIQITLRKIDALAATQPTMPLPRPMTVVPTTQPTTIARVALHARPTAIAWEPRAARAALAFPDGRIEIRTVPDLALLDSLNCRAPVEDLQFDSAGLHLLARCREHFTICDLEAHTAVARESSGAVVFHEDFQRIFHWRSDGRIFVSGIDGHEAWSRQIDANAGEIRFATWIDANSILLSTTTGRLMRLGAADGLEMWSTVAWSLDSPAVILSDQKWLLASVAPGAIGMFDVKTGNWLTGFAGNMDRVLDLAVDLRDQVVRTAGADGSIRTWNMTNSSPMHVAEKVIPIGSIARFDPDGSMLLVGDPTATLTLLNAP
jgi:serine/threonine-protein kinase